MNHKDTNINNALKSFIKTYPTLSQLEEWMRPRNLRLLLENTSIDENYKADTFFEPVLSNTNVVLGGRFL